MSKKIQEKHYYGTGRRKSCTARVFIYRGDGQIQVNKKKIQEYFSLNSTVTVVKEPLKILNLDKKFNIKASVTGGGITGQAEAIRHGLTRALVSYDEEFSSKEENEISKEEKDNIAKNTWKKKLRKAGFVTRDPRKVERKKVGFRKSRKKEQYSKR